MSDCLAGRVDPAAGETDLICLPAYGPPRRSWRNVPAALHAALHGKAA
ncbi:hypothetical protein ACFFGF_09000 [Asaia lannensis]|uniref:Uncharacterized protein n=1 Tax=Asaia lannensis NBRC 102526 TaxID=1307926 RepID=A0ABT1CI73_9PROT|nr:hypothetical protein [Asaia lannensis]MCO6160560.1 hypothetical protein [Asaia lannensis NBRC 102526]